jgi:hypothetical protein
VALLGRETRGEVVLIPRLRSALQHLNPDLPNEAIQLAIEELTRDRSTSLEATNREIYQLLKNGVKVRFKTDEDEEQEETVRVIDWNTPDNNQFLLVSQFSVTGEIYNRRADLIGFVNGLPSRLHRTQSSPSATRAGIPKEPDRLQKHDSSSVLVQRLDHPLQRQKEPSWGSYRRIGAFLRMEED